MSEFDADAFVHEKQQQQAIRRADPAAFLEAAMTELWEGGREEDMVERWRGHLEDPWYTSDLLWAIDTVADDPPADLIARLERAGVRLFHHGATEVTPYTFEEAVGWVAAQGERLRAIGDEAAG
jgi:hypothetical protein